MIKFSTHVWYFKSSILSMDRRANLLTQFKCLVTVKTVKIKFAPVSSVYKRVAHSNQGCFFAFFIMKLYRSSYSVIQLFFFRVTSSEWRHRYPNASLNGRASTFPRLSFALLDNIFFKSVFGRLIVLISHLQSALGHFKSRSRSDW